MHRLASNRLMQHDREVTIGWSYSKPESPGPLLDTLGAHFDGQGRRRHHAGSPCAASRKQHRASCLVGYGPQLAARSGTKLGTTKITVTPARNFAKLRTSDTDTPNHDSLQMKESISDAQSQSITLSRPSPA
ncbi:hypothetical protein AC578_10559 [Pseudocercospora eumusae]|uniref:Uncharacterized protein n=1 Tax=Pseudocercospora eumusae TaxID=321146 RepID=A0A139H5B7_9PEZI|nr:hypothetical protein AC578_10559 [Pseudocercospora eumusae]